MMKIIYQGSFVDIEPRVKEFSRQLQDMKAVRVCSIDSKEHIAAYIAWRRVGGRVIIETPSHDQLTRDRLFDTAIHAMPNNHVCLFTSGTTGYPTPRFHSAVHDALYAKMATKAMLMDADTNFLSYLPPFTSGLWHLVLPAWYKHKFTLTLGDRSNIANDVTSGPNLTIFVPNMIDMIAHANIDLSRLLVLCGASQIHERHGHIVFSKGARGFVTAYGATEFGSPILFQRWERPEGYQPTFDLSNTIEDVEVTFNQNNELCVSGPSLSYGLEAPYCSHDVFDIDGAHVTFLGRSVELTKLNGHNVCLPAVEEEIKTIAGIRDCILHIHTKAGVDYLSCTYENDVCVDIKRDLQGRMDKRTIPLRYNFVSSLERTALGKKVRRV